MKLRAMIVATCAVLIGSCSSTPLAPIRTVPQVDLPRYMGDWYVIANIPPFIEQGAHNSVERYRLDADGTIATTFTWRKGGFDGETKALGSRGFVLDATHAVWGIQFWFWPLKADYRIAYLADDYGQTVVAREKRDYAWIMARTPEIAAADYARLVQVLAELGYDVSRVQRVPQRWS